MSDIPTPTPAPEPQSTTPPTTPPAPAAADAGTGLKPHVAAGLCCILPIVCGIVFLVLEKRDKFVRFWAMQSLVFGGAAFVASIAFRVVGFIFAHLPLIGGLLGFLLWLFYLVFGLALFAVWILCIVKAFSKQEWEIPYLGKIAREQLAKLDQKNAAPPAAAA